MSLVVISCHSWYIWQCFTAITIDSTAMWRWAEYSYNLVYEEVNVKKCLIYVGLILSTSIATTLFQPLTYLESWASPTQPLQDFRWSQTGCQTYKETGKTVCGRFLEYWKQNGGLAQQGYPISNEFRERSDLNGQEYTVQYFERAVFEMHPENKPPYDVLLSQLGTFQFKRKYPNGEPGAPPPTPVPPPGLGTRVQLQEGVSITLVDEYEGHKTAIRSDLQCNKTVGMQWTFKIENTSKLPFTVNTENFRQVDSTGKKYDLLTNCGLTGSPGLGEAFTQATTVAPGGVAKARAAFDVTDVPSNATYLEMQVKLSGQERTFRYPLR
jgi:hypothetical protein